MKKTLLIFALVIITVSLFSQPVYTIDQGGTRSSCNVYLYDNGNTSAAYDNNRNDVITICSNNPNLPSVRASFNTFDVPDPADVLTIYDGNAITAPVLGAFTGALTPFSVQSSISNATGCLTFKFTTNATTTGQGFWASTICIPQCQQIISALNYSECIPTPHVEVGSTYMDVCYGDTITFSAGPQFPENNASYSQDASTCTYLWDFGDGTTATGRVVNKVYSLIKGYDVSLTVKDQRNCTNTNSLGLRVRISGNPFGTIRALPTICSGTELLVNVGTAPSSSIHINSFGASQTSSQLFDSTMFIPDGPSCPTQCYNSFVTFNSFSPGQTVTSANDIHSICVGMEHSYSGDLGFRIICPSGQSVVLDPNVHSGGSFMGTPYGGTSHDTYDNGCLPANNLPGTGAPYCWSQYYNPPSTRTLDWLSNNSGTTIPLTDTINHTSSTYIQPNNTLSGLIGCPLNGTWSIEICDDYAIDNGYVFWWKLSLDPLLLPVVWSYDVGINNIDWSGPFINEINDSTINIVPTTGGTYNYSVTLHDDFGCSYDTTFSLNVVSLPNVNLGSDDTVCSGVTLSAGGPFSSYLWNTLASTQTIEINNQGNYWVRVSNNSNGITCYNEDTIFLKVNPLPTVNAGLDQAVYPSNSVILSGSGAATYTWSNGVINGIPFVPLTTTTYTVTGTDGNGCSKTDQVIVTVIQNTYNVITSSNPSNGGTTIGSGAYQYNQQVTVTATEYSGFSFVNWTENGIQVSTNLSYNFIIADNRNLVANFNQNSTPDIYVSPISISIYEESKKSGDLFYSNNYKITDNDLLIDRQIRGLAARVIVPESVTKNWRKNMLNKYDINKATVVDWSIYDSPVRNQGQCGSCWAFSAVGLIENLNNRASLIANPNFSEQELVSCVSNHCNGGWYWNAFQYVKNNGLVPENCFPYNAINGNCSNQCPSPNNVVNISQYTNNLWNENPTVSDLKLALQQGVLNVAMYVPNDFFNYHGGIYNYQSGSYQWGHAVLLVGYNDNEQCFKVKNSWGSSNWGESGYFRISYNDVTDIPKFGSYASYAEGIYLAQPTPVSAETFTIYNTGSANLVVNNITSNKTWLSISPQSGIITPLQNSIITVSIPNWNLLTNAIETATLTINTNDPDEPNTTVTVTAVKSVNSEAPQLLISTDFYQDAELSSTTAFAEINIGIIGNETVNWSAQTSDTWMSLINSSGTNNGVVTVNCSSNSTGSRRTGYVTLSSPDVANSPQIVSITQGINNAPVITDFNKTIYIPTDTVHFSASEFTNRFSDIDGNSLQYIRVISSPDSGTFILNNIPIIAYQTVALSDIQNFVFVPNTGWSGNASFEYNASDGTNFAVNNASVNFIYNSNPVSDLITENIKIYPNPVNDNLQIQTALKIDIIEISDITGKLLYKTTFKTIDCSSFANGVYFVRVKTQNGVLVKKFVKE